MDIAKFGDEIGEMLDEFCPKNYIFCLNNHILWDQKYYKCITHKKDFIPSDDDIKGSVIICPYCNKEIAYLD